MPRKAKPDRDKGKPVRLSNEVLIAIGKKKRTKGESCDSVLRRMLGLPDRNNKPQPLSVYWLLESAMVVKKSLAEAKGEAVLQSVRKGKKKVMEAPIKVIEVL